MDERPQRRTPAHLPVRETFNRSVVVLVTVCTARRKRILCRGPVHDLLTHAWCGAELWCVGRYVIMPDHLHLFCAPGAWDYPPLTQWVQYWKGIVSRQWPWPHEQPIWQKSFWDRQLRTGDSYAAKWEYVRHNPVRHGLAATPDEWPYQGEMSALEWHD